MSIPLLASLGEYIHRRGGDLYIFTLCFWEETQSCVS